MKHDETGGAAASNNACKCSKADWSASKPALADSSGAPNQPQKSTPMEKAWAYPVVANDRLYIRDHQMLWCYDVKSGT